MRAAPFLVILLVVATWGEGGGSPGALLAWHLLLLVAVAHGLVRPGPGASPPLPTGLPGALLALGAVCAVAFFRAPYFFSALLTAIELAACIATMWLAYREDTRWLERAAPWLLGAAALHGGWAVFGAVATGERAAGTFLNPNHLGLWLTVVLLLATGIRLGGRAPRSGVFPVAAVGALAGLVATRSRGAWLAALVGCVVLAWLLGPGLSRARRRALAGVLLVVGIAGAAAVTSRLADYDPFRYHRLRIWKATLAGVFDRPAWGSGPGQFATYAAAYRFPDGEGPLRYDKVHSLTHSDALRLPAELGVPALLGLLAVLAAFAPAWWRGRERGGGVFAGTSAGLAAVAAHALIDNPSRWPAVYVLASVLAGVLLRELAASPEDVPTRRAPLPFRAVAVLALLHAFAVADVAPYLAWRATADLPRGRLAPSELARLESAIARNPLHAGYRVRVAEHHAAAPMTPATYAAAREAAEAARRLQPNAAPPRLALARVEDRACREHVRTRGCRERTRAAYEAARRAAPYDPAIPLALAVFLVETGDPVGAKAAAEATLALEPESVLPRLVLADAVLELHGPGAGEAARALLEEAERKAAAAEGWRNTPAGRHLLTLDPEGVERLRQRIRRELGEEEPT